MKIAEKVKVKRKEKIKIVDPAVHNEEETTDTENRSEYKFEVR